MYHLDSNTCHNVETRKHVAQGDTSCRWCILTRMETVPKSSIPQVIIIIIIIILFFSYPSHGSDLDPVCLATHIDCFSRQRSRLQSCPFPRALESKSSETLIQSQLEEPTWAPFCYPHRRTSLLPDILFLLHNRIKREKTGFQSIVLWPGRPSFRWRLRRHPDCLITAFSLSQSPRLANCCCCWSPKSTAVDGWIHGNTHDNFYARAETHKHTNTKELYNMDVWKRMQPSRAVMCSHRNLAQDANYQLRLADERQPSPISNFTSQ